MKKMMLAWMFLVVLLVGGLLFIGVRFKDSIREYEILEIDMNESANAFLKLREINLNPGESMKISANELIESGLLKSMEVGSDTCEGYVFVKKQGKNMNIESKIKCSQYTSLEYEEE